MLKSGSLKQLIRIDRFILQKQVRNVGRVWRKWWTVPPNPLVFFFCPKGIRIVIESLQAKYFRWNGFQLLFSIPVMSTLVTPVRCSKGDIERFIASTRRTDPAISHFFR